VRCTTHPDHPLTQLRITRWPSSLSRRHAHQRKSGHHTSGRNPRLVTSWTSRRLC
jgi:hypothetical protein